MNKSFKKNTEEIVCSGCDFSTSRPSHFNKHLLTAKHQRMLDGCENGQKRYDCKLCDFISCHHTNYEEHLVTAKHLKMLETFKNCDEKSFKKNTEEDIEPKICGCGKEYKYKKAFEAHKKSCSYTKPIEPLENTITPKDIIEYIENITAANAKIMQKLKDSIQLDK